MKYGYIGHEQVGYLVEEYRKLANKKEKNHGMILDKKPTNVESEGEGGKQSDDDQQSLLDD